MGQTPNDLSDQAPLRILLVEDSEDDAQLIMLRLEADGLPGEFQRVQTESSFRAALTKPIDLIMSDYALPQFNGMRALQIVKELGLDIPFILISGTVGEDIAVSAIKQGADDYLMKDRLARLTSAVQHALESKRLRQQQKLSDQSLRDSEERYRSIFENANVAIWEEDLTEIKAALDKLHEDGVTNFRAYMEEHPEFLRSATQQIKIVEANNAMLKLYGAKHKSELLVSLDQFVAPENIKEELIALANGTTYYEREMVIRTLQGQPMALLLSVSYFKGPTGRCKALVCGIDIGQRIKVEENLRNAELQYRTLVEQIPPIIYTARVHQHIGVTYISPRITTTLGFTQAEWMADPELWFRQVHIEDQQRILDVIEDTRINNKPFKAEYRIRSRDGKIFWFLDEVIDVLDGNGVPLFRQGYMLDITARKQAEERLREQNAYLALLNQMTHTILLADNYDAALRALAYDMKNIIEADDCYILRWNEADQRPIPITTTADLDFMYAEVEFNNNEITVTESVLRAGRVITVEDVFNSPHIHVNNARRFPARSIIGVPLIVGTHKLGAVIIAFNSHHQFSQLEIERVETAGNQMALALWEFQQAIEIEHRLKENNALAQIGRALSETEHIGSDKVLQLIVDSALELIERAEESVIHLIDADGQTLVPRAISGFDTGTRAFEKNRMRLGRGVAGHVIHTGETINVGDVRNSPHFLMQETQPNFLSLLVAPVQGGDKQIGTISVQSDELNAFSARDEELLNALGVQAAIAIENTNLFESTQQRLKEVNALYRTSQGLASALDIDQLITDVVNLLQQNFGYYHTQIYLLDPESGDLVLKSSSDNHGVQLAAQEIHMARGLGIIGYVAETARPFVTNDVNNVVFFVRNPLLPDTQSELAVPIKVAGEVAGVLDIQHTHERRLTDNDLQLMVAVAEQLSVAIQKANLYNNLQTALKQEQTVRTQLIQSERLALVGQLLASVSHELNNPLQAIQNALFLLKDEEYLSAQGKQDLDVILSETERMAALIERLRSAYRPTRINDFQNIEINTLIEDVHMLIATHMRNKEIAFEFHPASQTPVISGFPDQIRQVILNLFLNAIEAMKPGGCIVVSTRSLPSQNEILLTVKDTGPGIAADILPRIFEAFATDKHTGTGLGLTITRDIIEQHHGRISAENDPEGGAIFQVWFPIIQRGQV